jgi:hypothetical protein
MEMRGAAGAMRAHALALASLVAFGSSAYSAAAAAYQAKGSERTDYTAYTLNGGEISLGLVRSEIGIIDEITLGTYVPTWFASPVLGAAIPSGYLKLRAPLAGALAVSTRASAFSIDADVLASEVVQNSGGSANVFVAPLQVAASYRFHRRFTQSLEATYVLVNADGEQRSDADIRGAAIMSNGSLSALSELRLTRVLALTLLLRAMVYRGNARLESQFTEGSTTVDAELGAGKPYRGLVASAVPGAAFSFSHVNFHVGVGYGNWWLPGIELPLPDYGLVPEAELSVRF